MEKLGFRIEKRGDVDVLVYDGLGCRPASEPEVVLLKKCRELEANYVFQGSLLEAVEIALDGGDDPGDFMMSFPLVRRAWDMAQRLKEDVKTRDEL